MSSNHTGTQWWTGHQNYSALAKVYVAMPVASMDIERFFSKRGSVLLRYLTVFYICQLTV